MNQINKYSCRLMMYLDPGLPGHVPFLHLVASQWATSIVLWSLPAQVDMMPCYFQHHEVLWSTRCR